jgi:hypothetical protein
MMYPDFDGITRYEMIETVIPAAATATRFNFNDQPQLRTDQNADVIVQGLEVYTVADVPLSPNNNTVITAALLKQTYLVLYVNGEESLYRIPLVKLHTINNFADAFNNAESDTPRFDNLLIDWTKSYLFTPAAYGNGALFSILLGVIYKKLPPGTMAVLANNQYVNYVTLKKLQLPSDF